MQASVSKPTEAPDTATAAGAAACAVQVARQPIFNRELTVMAYELLYRAAGAQTASFTDSARATTEVVASATLDIGLAQLVGERPAFLNVPSELIGGIPRLPIDPGRIVIEMLEGADPDAKLLGDLGRLREAGFRVALDDYDLRLHSPALLECADIVKIDVQQHAPEELDSCVRTLRRRDLRLVAEKVETADELRLCMDLGFDYFQGYFLQRPEVFAARRAPSSRIAALQTIVSLSEPEVSMKELEDRISRDVGLSYRILRCINSSYYRMPREISSLRQAVTLLGFEELRRLCALVMLADMNDRPAYVSIQALARARMCESLCVMAGMKGSDAFFMTGLLSTLDVLLGLPLNEALRSLPLNAPVRAALLEQAGALGEALDCAKRYERGDWDRARFCMLSGIQIGEAYTRAVGWADAAWSTVPGGSGAASGAAGAQVSSLFQ